MVATITPKGLLDLRNRGEAIDLIDVRTPAEYGEVHIDFARNLPLDRLDPKALTASQTGRTGPIYFVCRSGGRSKTACEQMIAAGISNVVSVEGGTTACDAAGLPVVRGQKAISLERQVRIVAGLLIVAGSILAAFGPDQTWQNIGTGLAAFVGAGLIFAGVTDTCGMAIMLGRMPWNQMRVTTCARLLLTAIIAAATAGPALAGGHTKDPLPSVQQALTSGQAVLVDVREPNEWNAGHIQGARLVPLSALERGIDPTQLAQLLPQDKIIYCHCLVGGRCLEAAALLRPLGYDVRPLKPGYPALVEAGFPAAVGQ
jgi:rhodanese-related sulfurtransferase